MSWAPCTCVVPTPTLPVPPTAYTHDCSVCGGYYSVCGRCLEWLGNGREHGLGKCEAPNHA